MARAWHPAGVTLCNARGARGDELINVVTGSY
jgi:hypothetical protein